MDDAAEPDHEEPVDDLALPAALLDGEAAYSPSVAPDSPEHGLARPDHDGPAPSHAGVVDPPAKPPADPVMPQQMVFKMEQLKMERLKIELRLLLLTLLNLVHLESLLADEKRSLDGPMSTATIAGIFVVSTSWTRAREPEMSRLGSSEFTMPLAGEGATQEEEAAAIGYRGIS
eukprot:s661_g8.t1